MGAVPGAPGREREPLETISIREAAERLGISVKVARRLVSQGALRATKSRGPHGEEWRVDVASLEAYQHDTAPPPPSPSPAWSATPSPSPAAPDAEVEALRRDKAFLERQVETLTALLRRALESPPAAPPPGGVPAPAAEAADAPAPHGALAGPGPSLTGVTEALQSSLRLVDPADVGAVEMCSVKVLWGRPVLWRLRAREPEDVRGLMNAILAPGAAWDAPGEEVVFLWVTDGAGAALWGCACGPGWFGPGFEEAVRAARVERA